MFHLYRYGRVSESNDISEQIILLSLPMVTNDSGGARALQVQA
jgi:hypothetical protein